MKKEKDKCHRNEKNITYYMLRNIFHEYMFIGMSIRKYNINEIIFLKQDV